MHMTAIPHAALALTSALDRFGHASARVLEAVTGRDDVALGEAFVETMEAKTQAKAGVAVIRLSDEMLAALMEIAKAPQDRH
jgi:hypothetical protein